MKKKNIKPIVISALLAAAFGATSVGTSFALFTDSSETSISVTAGKVDVETSLSDIVAYSANALGTGTVVDKDENNNTYVLEDQSTLDFVNGGNVAYNTTTKKLTLDKMTPGDGVRFNLTSENKSNVATKVRFKLEGSDATNDEVIMLYGLRTKINNASQNISLTKDGLRKYVTEWITLGVAENVPEQLGTFNFDIYMPLSKGNVYQNKSVSFNLSVEAVQANAVTEDESTIDIIDGLIEVKEDTPLLQESGSYVLLNDVDVDNNSNFVIPANTDVSLDLHGNELTLNKRLSLSSNTKATFVDTTESGDGKVTVDGDSFIAVVPNNGAELTIESGSYVNAGGGPGIGVMNGGKLELNGGSVTAGYAGIYTMAGADVVINGGSVNAAGRFGVTIQDDDVSIEVNGGEIFGPEEGIMAFNDRADITITGGKITSDSIALFTLGTYNEETTVDISGGELIAPFGCNISAAKSFNMTGGKIIGTDGTALEVRAGDVTISGDAYLESREDLLQFGYNNSGTTSHGCALAIAQHGTQRKTTLNVTGGTFKGKCGILTANPMNNDGSSVVSYAVSGGTFDTDLYDVLNLDERVLMTVSGTATPIATEEITIAYKDSESVISNVVFDRRNSTDGFNYKVKA